MDRIGPTSKNNRSHVYRRRLVVYFRAHCHVEENRCHYQRRSDPKYPSSRHRRSRHDSPEFECSGENHVVEAISILPVQEKYVSYAISCRGLPGPRFELWTPCRNSRVPDTPRSASPPASRHRSLVVVMFRPCRLRDHARTITDATRCAKSRHSEQASRTVGSLVI